MISAAFEPVCTSARQHDLPVRIEQRTCDIATCARLTLLAGLLILLCLPYVWLGAAAAADPTVLAGITEQPRSLILALAGLGLGVLLLGLPAYGCLQRLVWRRRITLTRMHVEVTVRSLSGTTHWGCRIADFSGLVHHARAQGSGTRQELILLHPDPKRCLLLRVEAGADFEETHRLAELLGLPVLPGAAMNAGQLAGIAPSSELLPIAKRFDTEDRPTRPQLAMEA